MSDPLDLRPRANKLRLYGLLGDWGRLGNEPWVAELIDLEERERGRRSREYRIHKARIGNFKSMVDFNWKHPTKIDRLLVEDLLGLDFMDEAANGVGKTMIAQTSPSRPCRRVEPHAT